MSSQQGAEMELDRGSDLWKGAPEKFTVLGVDATGAQLKKRFSHNPWACAVIEALVSKRGERAVDVPEVFWHSLRIGVVVPISFVYLGKDADGTKVRLVACGQHRTVGLRKVNAELRAVGGQPLLLQGKAERLPKDKEGIAAALAALDLRTAENNRVGLRPSDLAALALKHDNAGRTLAAIAANIGLREETAATEVPMYIALSQCVEEVQHAVDTMKLPLARCLRLAKQSEEKQRAAVAPKEKGAPREQRRTLPGEFAKTWAEKLPAKYDAAVAALRFMAGDLTALDGYPSLKQAAEDAGLDFETGRVKRAS